MHRVIHKLASHVTGNLINLLADNIILYTCTNINHEYIKYTSKKSIVFLPEQDSNNTMSKNLAKNTQIVRNTEIIYSEHC